MRSRATVQSPAGFDKQVGEPKYLQSERGLAAQNFKMNVRVALPNFPVPCLRPTTANKVSVFDVCPNGAPVEITGEGLAWIDVVDTDVESGDPDACSARVGITSTAVQFGSRSFNAAADKPIEFVMGTNAGEVVGRVLANRAWRLGSDAGAGGHLQGPWVASPDSDHSANTGYTFTVENLAANAAAFARCVVATDVNTAELRSYSATFSTDSGNYANAGHVLATAGRMIVTCEAGNAVYLLPSNSSFSAVTDGLRVAAGECTPKSNNTQKLGSSSLRWSEVFATNGTINTSDKREKTDVRNLELGLAFIDSLRPVTYRWRSRGSRLEEVETGEFEEVQVPVTREVKREKVKVLDGRAVLVIVTEIEAVTDELPVVDEAGRPVMEQREVRVPGKKKGTFTRELRDVPRVVTVPRMRTERRPIKAAREIHEKGKRQQFGLLAQELRAALEAAGVDAALWSLADPSDPDSLQQWRPDQMIPVLIRALQELAARVVKLERA